MLRPSILDDMSKVDFNDDGLLSPSCGDWELLAEQELSLPSSPVKVHHTDTDTALEQALRALCSDEGAPDKPDLTTIECDSGLVDARLSFPAPIDASVDNSVLHQSWISCERPDSRASSEAADLPLADVDPTAFELVDDAELQKQRSGKDARSLVTVKIVANETQVPCVTVEFHLIHGDEEADKATHQQQAPTANHCKSEAVFLLLGKAGSGKSTTANAILGRPAFKSKRCPRPVTAKCQMFTLVQEYSTITVIDTPGVVDSGSSWEVTHDNILQAGQLSPTGLTAVLAVFSIASKFTDEDSHMIDCMTQEFGCDVLDRTIAVFTHGDELEGEDGTLEQYLEDCPKPLQEFLSNIHHRVVLMNNKAGHSEEHVAQLLQVAQGIAALPPFIPLPMLPDCQALEYQEAFRCTAPVECDEHARGIFPLPGKLAGSCVDAMSSPRNVEELALVQDAASMDSSDWCLASHAQLQRLECDFHRSEQHRMELLRQLREGSRVRRSIMVAASLCGMLLLKHVAFGGGCKSASPAARCTSGAPVFNLYGPIHWVIEPKGFPNCGSLMFEQA